jgi:hypothetical protein
MKMHIALDEPVIIYVLFSMFLNYKPFLRKGFFRLKEYIKYRPENVVPTVRQCRGQGASDICKCSGEVFMTGGSGGCLHAGGRVSGSPRLSWKRFFNNGTGIAHCAQASALCFLCILAGFIWASYE